MLHRHRVILKRGMQIGLAEMPGVTGFGKECKIREALFPHDLSSTLQIVGGIRAAIRRVDRRQKEQQYASGYKQQKDTGISHSPMVLVS